MLGLGGGLALSGTRATFNARQQIAVRSGAAGAPIVAWGDSLTSGYVPLAAALLGPGKAILNLGIGGQTSTQVAARQGGVPIVVTLAGNTIPAAIRLDWNILGEPDDWVAPDPAITIEVAGPKALRISQPGNIAGASARRLIAPAPALGVIAGSVVKITATVDNSRNEAQEIGLVNTGSSAGTGGSWVTVNRLFADKSRSTVTNILSATPANNLVLTIWLTDNTARTVMVTEPVVEIATPVAITAKSVNVLTDNGSYAGAVPGMLAGVHGVVSTDGAGNWTFLRDSPGPAASCPPDSLFVPDGVPALRDHTAWIWVGRNNYDDAARVKADIAAMVGHLGHTRYLIGGIINGNYEAEFAGADGYEDLVQLNADLAAQYGANYVDIRRALIQAADPVADAIWVERDTVPASLRSDNLHLNAMGNAIVAQQMVAAMRRKGW